MAKALRVFIVLLLLLSVASLILGIMLFNKREIMKGRTQKLENTVMDVAAKLAAPTDPFIKALEIKLDKNQLMTFTDMETPLRQLAALTDTRYTELNQVYGDLKVMTDRLEETNRVLTATKQELAMTKEQLAQTRQELETTRAELAAANEKIAQLEQDKANLQIQIDDLNTQLVKAEEEIQTLKDEVADLKKEIERIAPTVTKANLPAGTAGRIMIVNPDWNFVILDIGSSVGLVPSAEMLVHRADQLVGKVRISTVRENIAVAEILGDWEKMPPKEGDSVLF